MPLRTHNTDRCWITKQTPQLPALPALTESGSQKIHRNSLCPAYVHEVPTLHHASAMLPFVHSTIQNCTYFSCVDFKSI